MREIDRRIRFLTKRLEAAVVVDPEAREATDQIFFSATVGLLRGDGREQTVKIVGVDEIDTAKNKNLMDFPFGAQPDKSTRRR